MESGEAIPRSGGGPACWTCPIYPHLQEPLLAAVLFVREEPVHLGNLLRRLGPPKAVEDWSLRSLQLKLIKVGGRAIRHLRRVISQFAEVAVLRDLFATILEREDRLRVAPG